MSILAIDPGASSGWALWTRDGITSGRVAIDTDSGRLSASNLLATIGLDRVVIEAMGYLPRGEARYDTAYGMGRHAGIWEALALTRCVPVEWVHPSKWQRAMLSVRGRNPGRPALKGLSMAVATRVVGHPVGSDEADAICLLEWYVVEARLKGHQHV